MPRKPVREVEVLGDVAFVTLTQGFEALIDADDAETVGMHNWHVAIPRLGKHLRYAVRGALIDGRKVTLGMHRQILNAPDGVLVDHINGNPLDNRKCNLRLATASQNMHNKRMQKNNTSGFKGVHWDKNKRKWQANIKIGDKRRFLGGFDTAEEASCAYKNAAKQLHGEFIRLK